MGLLDFGTSYDALLRKQAHRDAHETVQYGVLSLQLSGQPLDTQLLIRFSHYHVTSVFGLDTHQEAQVHNCLRDYFEQGCTCLASNTHYIHTQALPDLPGVTVSRPVRSHMHAPLTCLLWVTAMPSHLHHVYCRAHLQLMPSSWYMWPMKRVLHCSDWARWGTA